MKSEEIISELNDEMMTRFQKQGLYFDYRSDGYCECIGFMDIIVWDSENYYCDEKYNNDDEDYYTPDKEVIKTIMINLICDLQNIFGEKDEKEQDESLFSWANNRN